MQSNMISLAFAGSDFANLDTQGCDAIKIATDTTGRAVRGIVRSGFRDCEQIFLVNEGPDNWTLTDDDEAATAENRIYLTTGDKIMTPGPPFWLVYNETGPRGAGWYGEVSSSPTILAYGAEGSVSTAAVRYLLPWDTSNSGNVSIQSMVVPFDCIARDMYVATASAGTGTGTIDFMLGTVSDDGATFTPTALHVDYDVDGALKQADTTNVVSLVKGQRVGVRTTPTNVTGAPARPYVTLALYPV
jgi:hypothetical protein